MMFWAIAKTRAAPGVLVFALVMGAGAALPMTSGPALARSASAPLEPKAQPVCKYEVTGTRIRTRVCKTAREWQAIQDQSKEDLGEFQSRQDAVNYGPGGRNACPPGVKC